LLGVEHAELDRLALEAPAGARGLSLVPFFDGERTPNRPTAQGLLSGLRSNVSRQDLARAAFEGVVCGLLDGLSSLARQVPADGSITLVGGGAASLAYQRILADLSGRPVRIFDEIGSTVALGACVQAAATLQGASAEEVRAAWPMAQTQVIEPDLTIDSAAIREAYARCRDEGAANPEGSGEH
jgi:xylulokinase